MPPLRFLPPGQVAVSFDVAERHLGFDTFDLVEQIRVSHQFTRDSDDGNYRRGSSRHRYAWPAQLGLMARIAGLELERRIADGDGALFTEDSAKPSQRGASQPKVCRADQKSRGWVVPFVEKRGRSDPVSLAFCRCDDEERRR